MEQAKSHPPVEFLSIGQWSAALFSQTTMQGLLPPSAVGSPPSGPAAALLDEEPHPARAPKRSQPQTPIDDRSVIQPWTAGAAIDSGRQRRSWARGAAALPS